MLQSHISRYHPDKNVNNPEASDLFKEVSYSYSILSNPEKRRQFDAAGFEVEFWIYLSFFQKFKLNIFFMKLKYIRMEIKQEKT